MHEPRPFLLLARVHMYKTHASWDRRRISVLHQKSLDISKTAHRLTWLAHCSSPLLYVPLGMATPFKAHFCESTAKFTSLIQLELCDLHHSPTPPPSLLQDGGRTHSASCCLSIWTTAGIPAAWRWGITLILGTMHGACKRKVLSWLQDGRNALPGTYSFTVCTENILKMSNKWEDLQWEQPFQVVSN